MASTLPQGATAGGGTGTTSAPSFTDALRARSDSALVALLRARPDLATPSPSTLRSLAARASSRTSLERALAHADARTLHVLEAVLVLASVPDDGTARVVGPRAVAAALTDAADAVPVVEQVLDQALEAALVWDAGTEGRPDLRPSPGLDEVLGPYPAGLGPVRKAGPVPDLDDLPPGGREILDALAWGPPVGVVPPPRTPAREAVDALVGSELLVRTDARHVLLPRDVGLALRGGRTHRSLDLGPPRPAGTQIRPDAVEAEASSAALELVRQVDVLVAAWEGSPPSVLRSGGLGVRDLRRTAQLIEADERRAAFVVELAAGAGLVSDDGEAPASYVPTSRTDAWDDLDDAARWALLAQAWATSRRTAWQVGSRDERGTVRAPLSPDLHRPWVPRLRAQVLDVLAAQPGTALGPDDVMAVLRWRTPRAAPPESAVHGLMREAAWVGATGAGALSSPGRALVPLASEDRPSPVPDGGLADTLRAVLPAPVDEILLQGDLTGIVPGRPSQDLARLLERTADAESRGAATTVRFSTTSITRALDHGATADELLGELARRSPVPVPQPLEYLVKDTARRHEALRVGSAGAYVRAADPAILAGLVEDPRLSHLGLVRLAPTVLAAAVPAAELHEALRDRGLLSALEGPDGRVVGRLRRAPRIHRTSDGRRSTPVSSPMTDDGRLALVERLREAEVAEPRRTRPGPTDLTPASVPTVPYPETRAAHAADRLTAARSSRPVPPPSGTDDPGEALAVLYDALRDGRRVSVELVGSTGALERRELRPLRLDGGRLRALDPDRQAELTIAVHRIASVSAVETPPQTHPDSPADSPSDSPADLARRAPQEGTV